MKISKQFWKKYRSKILKGIRTAHKRSSFKNKVSINAKKQWANNTSRNKILKASQSKEANKKRSNSIRKSWKNTKIRKARRRGLRRAWFTGKFNNMPSTFPRCNSNFIKTKKGGKVYCRSGFEQNFCKYLDSKRTVKKFCKEHNIKFILITKTKYFNFT